MEGKKYANITIKRNAIADCFKILSIFFILIGIIGIIFNFIVTYKENAINFSFIASTVISILFITVIFFVLRAIAEIIQLLEDIKNK